MRVALPEPLDLTFDRVQAAAGRIGDDGLFCAGGGQSYRELRTEEGAIVTTTSDEVRFAQWRLARPQGSPWRWVADVERGDEHLGEIEACLSFKAAAGLATDLGRDIADEELAAALRAYVEARVRTLLDQGEDLSDHSLIIEVDNDDRDVLHPYLSS